MATKIKNSVPSTIAKEKKGGGVERGRERLTQKAAFFAAAAQWKVHFSRSKAPPTDSACTPAAWGR